ncbi:MAG: lipopolysaccharide transport periplasmic protein LptA [Gammaproteobacteria bacterium]|nr:lipopolysaccharide transport periplasmic protein LptA [Gammaproteobacteria bacterium]
MRLNKTNGWAAPGLLVLSLALSLPIPTGARESDKNQPIFVEADAADINDQSGVSVYSGDVKVTQGTVILNADKVTIIQKAGKTDQVIAEGSPVEFQQMTDKDELIKARAKKADYYLASELLHMTGDAVLIQGKDSFSSDRITIDRSNGQVKAGTSAQGKQRVRISIQPKTETKP